MYKVRRRRDREEYIEWTNAKEPAIARQWHLISLVSSFPRCHCHCTLLHATRTGSISIMKRRAMSPSSSTLPPMKRVHASLSPGQGALTFDNMLYDELILSIFSYLSYIDLCNIQRTNSNLSRLSLDNQVYISSCKLL